MNSPVENPALSVPCRCLRTKRMFIPSLADGAADLNPDPHDQTFFWCNKALSALGPDDNQVHPHLCQPGRTCHEV